MKILRALITVEHIALCIILVLGFFLRVQHANLNLWQDEFYTAMAVKGVLQTGLPEMPSHVMYVRAFPYTYFISLIQSILPFSEFTLRLPSIIIGLVSLAYVYVILKARTHKWFALAAVFLIAISPWHITYSLLARSYIVQALLFLLIGWNYVRYMNEDKESYLWWNVSLITLNSLLTPISLLSIFMLGYVVWYRKYVKKLHYSITDVSVIMCNIVAIFVGFFVPSAIIPWSQELSANAYSLAEVQNAILLNSYFWKTLIKMFPIGAVCLFFSTIYFWYKDKQFFLFPFFLCSAFVFLSIFNPFGNLQPRYLANFMMIYYVSVFYLMYELLHKKSLLIACIVCVFMIDIYALPAQFTFTYGKELPKTMMVSESWTEFPDTKSQVIYMNEHADEKDIIISLQPKGHSEVYTTKTIDYFLRTQNYHTEGHKDGAVWYDDYSMIPMITNAQEFQNILVNSSCKTVWVISSKSELPSQNHIDQATADILTRYGEIVYRGQDKYSKLYRAHIPCGKDY